MTVFGRGFGGKNKNAENSTGSEKSTALVDGVTAPTRSFGIRSYLHQFYQSPTVEDLENAGAWYLLPPPPAQRTGLYICRLLTVVGLLFLILGAAAIVIGYTWPHEPIEDSIERIAIYQDEDGNFYLAPEKLASILKDPMRHWKIIGLCMFSGGAVLLSISFLIPTCVHCFKSNKLAAFVREDGTPNEPPIRIYPASCSKSEAHSEKQGNTKISPTSGPVPVMEEIAKVQPSGAKEKEKAATSADELLLADSSGH